jgi:hypothetical protein
MTNSPGSILTQKKPLVVDKGLTVQAEEPMAVDEEAALASFLGRLASMPKRSLFLLNVNTLGVWG